MPKQFKNTCFFETCGTGSATNLQKAKKRKIKQLRGFKNGSKLLFKTGLDA
jgi:hypothetical protein